MCPWLLSVTHDPLSETAVGLKKPSVSSEPRGSLETCLILKKNSVHRKRPVRTMVLFVRKTKFSFCFYSKHFVLLLLNVF